jgi:hypothetical protein
VTGESNVAAVDADGAHLTALRNIAPAGIEIDASPLLNRDRVGVRVLDAEAQCGDMAPNRGLGRIAEHRRTIPVPCGHIRRPYFSPSFGAVS